MENKTFDLKQCASCKELKKRAKDGQTKSGPVWVDESNRKWHGKTCPDCYAVKNRARHKKEKGDE